MPRFLSFCLVWAVFALGFFIPFSDAAPNDPCSVTTMYTCQRTLTQTAAGSCDGSCQAVCPSGYSISSNSCSSQFSSYGLLCLGGSVSCSTTTTSTYTSTTGCALGDTVLSQTTSQTGCAAGCFDGVSYPNQGACVNGQCQYSGGSVCPVLPPQTGSPRCEGDAVVRDDTLNAPTCSGTACASIPTTFRTTLQSCPFGCDAATVSCYPECRPGTNQACQENGFAGVQVCDSSGHFQACQLDLSSLCRNPPKLDSFGGGTTFVQGLLDANRFLDLKFVSNFVLERPGQFRIFFANPVDVCGVDFDSLVRSDNGFVSLDGSRLPPSIASAGRVTVVLPDLPPSLSYRLKVLDGFPQGREEVLSGGVLCTALRCSSVSFAGRQAVFDVTGFSGFAAEPSSAPSPFVNPSVDPSASPSVSPSGDDVSGASLSDGLAVRCPQSLVVEQNATVSVFNVQGGVPVCASGLSLFVAGNGSSQSSTLLGCEPFLGRHVFSVNTSESGLYAVTAMLDGRTDVCGFEVVGRAPTPTPELPVWLALAVILASGWLFVSSRRRRGR